MKQNYNALSWALALTATLLCQGAVLAQTDEDANIPRELLATSVNVFINANDSVLPAATVAPGSTGDVDLLISAISAVVDPGFDPVMEVRTLSGQFLASNDNWQVAEGSQAGELAAVIDCYVDLGIINPGPNDAVVLLSVDRFFSDTNIVADVRDFDGLPGRTVVSFLRVDGTLFNSHDCADI